MNKDNNELNLITYFVFDNISYRSLDSYSNNLFFEVEESILIIKDILKELKITPINIIRLDNFKYIIEVEA